MRAARLAVAAAAAAALLAPAPARGQECADVFPASFAASLAEAHPELRVTAAVHDTRTGCWHHLHRDLRLTTASVVKTDVLGAALLRAQEGGRPLTPQEAGWARVAQRLGHAATRDADVRSVSGGSTAPLGGQRACRPELREQRATAPASACRRGPSRSRGA